MAGDAGLHSVEEAHRIALIRSRALVLLREGPMSRSRLQDSLDTSKTTAYRTTTALDDHGYVERENGEFTLTAAGEVAAEYAEDLCRSISAVEHVDPLFELVDRRALGLDPAVFGDAVVTHATPREPYAPIRRFWSVVGSAERLSLLYNTVHAPDSMDRYAELVADGLDLEIVYDPETAPRNFEALEEYRPGLLAADGADLRVASESFGGGVALTEERVGVMGHDPTKGTPVVAVDTDATVALEWGESLFEHHHEGAEPVEAALTDG